VLVFCKFMDDTLGPCPDGMSLDRINNDGHYEPGNLQWATVSEQRFNRRVFRTSGGPVAPTDDFICTLDRCLCNLAGVP
jgi:hypothetical protein